MNPLLYAGSHIVSSVLGGPIEAATSPLTLGAQYSIADNVPKVVIPGPSELLAAVVGNRLTQSSYERFMKWHGINPLDPLWIASRKTHWQPPPIASILTTSRRDAWTPAVRDLWLGQHRIWEGKSLWTESPWDWTPEQIRILRAVSPKFFDPRTGPAGRAEVSAEDQYRNWLAGAGLVRSEDRAAFSALIQSVTYNEGRELAQRDLLIGAGKTAEDRGTPEEQRTEFNRLMALDDFTDPKIIDYLWALRQRLPTEGELIEAAVKNAFVGPLAKILQLDDEYHEQPQFIVGTDRLGLSGSPHITLPDMITHVKNHKLRAGNEIHGHRLDHDETDEEAEARATEYFHSQDGSLLTWAQVFWRSHWVNLSPTQIYTCLHRQRPVDTTKPGGAAALADYENDLRQLAQGEPAGNTAEARYAIAVSYARRFGRNPSVPPVTQDIVDTVLRANDYAPLFRPNLSAISFNVLRLVDIRRIVQLSLQNRSFAVSAIHYDSDIGASLPGGPNGGAGATALEKFVFAWARENFLDRGQTPAAAQSLATLAVRQGQTSNRFALRRVIKLLERAFKVGLINRDTFTRIKDAGPPPRAEFTSADFGEMDEVDIFAEADLAADLYDDSDALTLSHETEAALAAEDLLEEDFADV